MHLLKFFLFVILFAFYNQKLNADFDVESNYMILQDYHS